MELLLDERICIIHEINESKDPRVSLTNCIEHVIKEVAEKESLCASLWTFVQHSTNQNELSLFAAYHHYDFVDVSEAAVLWKYVWHNEQPTEKEKFSNELLIHRINNYRSATDAINH